MTPTRTNTLRARYSGLRRHCASCATNFDAATATDHPRTIARCILGIYEHAQPGSHTRYRALELVAELLFGELP